MAQRINRRCTRRIAVVLVAFGITLNHVASAALVDQGLTTLDTATGLEWLDMSQSVGISAESIIQGTDPGNLSGNGWSLASINQITTLLLDGGMTAPFDGSLTSTNYAAASAIIDLLGATGTTTVDFIQAFANEGPVPGILFTPTVLSALDGCGFCFWWSRRPRAGGSAVCEQSHHRKLASPISRNRPRTICACTHRLGSRWAWFRLAQALVNSRHFLEPIMPVLIAALALLLGAGQVSAALVTANFSGSVTVTDPSNLLGGAITDGDSFSGTFAYDLTATDTDPSPDSGNYSISAPAWDVVLRNCGYRWLIYVRH